MVVLKAEKPWEGAWIKDERKGSFLLEREGGWLVLRWYFKVVTERMDLGAMDRDELKGIMRDPKDFHGI